MPKYLCCVFSKIPSSWSVTTSISYSFDSFVVVLVFTGLSVAQFFNSFMLARQLADVARQLANIWLANLNNSRAKWLTWRAKFFFRAPFFLKKSVFGWNFPATPVSHKFRSAPGVMERLVWPLPLWGIQHTLADISCKVGVVTVLRV